MATIYRKRTNEILWDDSGIYCRLEDEYNELSEFIARKRLDGHDETDQWYMWVQLKMGELLDALDECPMVDDDSDIELKK